MATQVGPVTDKTDNKAGLIKPVASDWFPLRGFHDGPELALRRFPSRGRIYDCNRPSCAMKYSLTMCLYLREESIYDLLEGIIGAFEVDPWLQ